MQKTHKIKQTTSQNRSQVSDLASRPPDYFKNLEELRQTFADLERSERGLGNSLIMYYEQGKKDGLSKDQIRADITAAFGVITPDELKLLPPELKYILSYQLSGVEKNKPVVEMLNAIERPAEVTGDRPYLEFESKISINDGGHGHVNVPRGMISQLQKIEGRDVVVEVFLSDTEENE